MIDRIFSLSKRHYLAAALSLIVAAVYATTLNPAVSFIDSGELAAAATTLGIAHPTGYPLFTLLGRTLVVLPGPLEPVARLTLFSAALLLPALAFLVVRERGAAGLGRAIPVLALAFLLGLSIYAYLPLRSA